MDSFKPYLAKVATGASLTREEARAAFDDLLSGEVTPAQGGAFLMALRVRGEALEEIIGAAALSRPFHAAARSKKFFMIVEPCSERMLSGWNCAPWIGSDRCERAMIWPSRVSAVIARSGVQVSRSTTSE